MTTKVKSGEPPAVDTGDEEAGRDRSGDGVPVVLTLRRADGSGEEFASEPFDISGVDAGAAFMRVFADELAKAFGRKRAEIAAHAGTALCDTDVATEARDGIAVYLRACTDDEGVQAGDLDDLYTPDVMICGEDLPELAAELDALAGKYSRKFTECVERSAAIRSARRAKRAAREGGPGDDAHEETRTRTDGNQAARAHNGTQAPSLQPAGV